MFVPQVAEQFQKAGINALVYDPRTLGDSDGLPRNEIDPMKQMSDYSDALTFLLTQSTVDPNRIAFWGMSFSATIALCAASLDKRAKLCIAVCPLDNVEFTPEKLPRVLLKSMLDRQSQLSGNESVYLPVLTQDGRNPAGMNLNAGKDELEYMINAKSRGAPNHENRTTLQTYYKMAAWQPRGIMKFITTPVFMIIPELDTISLPADQLSLFETFPKPGKVHIASGKGHLNVLSGDQFPILMEIQAGFLRDGFENRLA